MSFWQSGRTTKFFGPRFLSLTPNFSWVWGASTKGNRFNGFRTCADCGRNLAWYPGRRGCGLSLLLVHRSPLLAQCKRLVAHTTPAPVLAGSPVRQASRPWDQPDPSPVIHQETEPVGP